MATSVAAFIGYTARGLDHRPQRLLSFADFERAFGGLAADSLVSYGVSHFFTNGGTTAWVVRVPKPDADVAAITLRDDVAAGAVALAVTALSAGAWANDVLVDIDHDVPDGDPKAFNLTITDFTGGAVETFRNVTLDDTAAELRRRRRQRPGDRVAAGVGRSHAGLGPPCRHRHGRRRGRRRQRPERSELPGCD